MKTYSFVEVSRLLGRHRSAVHRRVQTAQRHGLDVPGLTSSGVTDEFITWFRESDLRGHRGHAKLTDERRDEHLFDDHEDPTVSGLTAEARNTDPSELWSRMISHEQRDRKKTDLRRSQLVEVPGRKPILVALLSDVHFGNAHTAYAAAHRDAELIRDTPGCYGIIAGDTIDNWVSLKTVQVQREQACKHSDELSLLESWLAIMKDKLVAVVSGNHEQRTDDLVGIDILQRMLSKAKVLYDANEVRFDLVLGGEATWRFKLRHRWQGYSKYNVSHGMENDAHFNDGTWDVGIGAHTHVPTVMREFYDHVHDHRVKIAIQLGSYQYDSSYGRKLNMSRSVEGGSCGLMFWPDGELQCWRSLEKAARFLRHERTG